MHALAVVEIQTESVEAAAWHRHGETRAVLGIFEREEHRRPAFVAAELRHLTFDPHRRQPRDPRRDTFVERRDGVDLAVTVFDGLDFHPPIVPREV